MIVSTFWGLVPAALVLNKFATMLKECDTAKESNFTGYIVFTNKPKIRDVGEFFFFFLKKKFIIT